MWKSGILILLFLVGGTMKENVLVTGHDVLDSFATDLFKGMKAWGISLTNFFHIKGLTNGYA